ncbi:EthD domain-containing protein [Cladophialophora immunda]|nr:EthD domain-containing protein [Cladophialophora immunda]
MPMWFEAFLAISTSANDTPRQDSPPLQNGEDALADCWWTKQFHALPEYQNQEKVMGLPVLPFDGIVEVWIESVDKYVRHVSQEDIVKALAADEQQFMTREDAFIMVGYETLEIGEPVPGFA